MAHEKDMIARYLAMRVEDNEKDPTKGISKEKAIKCVRTSKKAIEEWSKDFKLKR